MILEKLSLKNYRGFEDIEIEFHDRLTVIVGTNGAGKSSILEGAAVSLSTFFAKFDGVKDNKINKTDAHLKTYKMGETDDVQPQYPVEIYAEGTIEGRKIGWKRSLNSEKGTTTIIDASKMINVSDEYNKRLKGGDKSLILPLIAYYGTGRLWNYNKGKPDVFKDNTKINGYLNSLDGSAEARLMLNWFLKKTVQMAQNNGKSTSELPVVFGAIEKCYERITGYHNVRITYNLDTNELNCSYRDENDDYMSVALSQLSDGYRCTISLIADMAYRMAVLNPQLGADVITETSGIVLIDEVDLHLHPSWQHRILSDLQDIFPKIQFIVTTHAPAVISSVRSENLIILKNNEILDAESETYGNDVNTILNEIMDVSERNPIVAELFKKFYTLLDDGKYDEAESVLDDIDEHRSYHDKEVAACRVKLRLERIRGGHS